MGVLALAGSLAAHWTFGLTWWQTATLAAISLACTSND